MTVLQNPSPLEGAIGSCLLLGFPAPTLNLYPKLVQRLFSMFPGGAAGCGLLLLRVCAAGMLFRNGIVDDAVSVPTWEIAGVTLLATAFCVGVFTPVFSILSAVMQIFMVLRAQESDPYHIVFTFCVTCAVFLLGPGAFSFDSQLFGRRLIVRSGSK